MMFCPNCGSELPNGSAACGFCGYRFTQEELREVSGAPVSSKNKRSYTKLILMILAGITAVLTVTFCVFALLSRSANSVKKTVIKAMIENDADAVMDVLSPNYRVGKSESDIKENVKNIIEDYHETIADKCGEDITYSCDDYAKTNITKKGVELYNDYYDKENDDLKNGSETAIDVDALSKRYSEISDAKHEEYYVTFSGSKGSCEGIVLIVYEKIGLKWYVTEIYFSLDDD